MLVTPQLHRELARLPWERGAAARALEEARREAWIGPRVGLRVGTRPGTAPGPNGDEIGNGGGGSFAGVSRDATSLIYVPANASEWTTFRTAGSLSIANPNSLWLCQEAAGNLADSIGAIALTATGGLFQQAVAGWSRKAVGTTDGSSDKFVAGAGVGPSPATTSQLWLFLMSLPATPAANRVIGGINCPSATNACRALHLTATGLPRNNVVGVNTDGASSISSAVHPVVVHYDRTNSVANLYTRLDKVVGTYSASVTDGDKGLGNAGASTASGRLCLYAAMWSGAAAEVSAAVVKSLLTTMGFVIPWS